LIAWVGYGPEHNSWTLERDLYVPLLSDVFQDPSLTPTVASSSGSTEIIDEYWNKKGGRPAPPSATKSKKKTAASQTSKRKSTSQTPQSKKHQLTGGGSPSRNGGKPPANETEEPMLADMADQHKDSIAKYKDLASWEEHVERISTVERGANNRLVVYMVM
jgi:hypothetical protein